MPETAQTKSQRFHKQKIDWSNHFDHADVWLKHKTLYIVHGDVEERLVSMALKEMGNQSPVLEWESRLWRMTEQVKRADFEAFAVSHRAKRVMTCLSDAFELFHTIQKRSLDVMRKNAILGGLNG